MAGTYLPAAPAAVCRTCKVEQPVEEFRPAPGMKAVVDHDHETGRVRGWLCRTCNGAIARLGDSPERLLRVAEYAMRGVSVL